jgi:hypothetical protein
MSISWLKNRGYDLPPPETPDNLTAKDILNNIADYQKRCIDAAHAGKEGNLDGIIDAYYLNYCLTILYLCAVTN